jgi:hypothetical protein
MHSTSSQSARERFHPRVEAGFMVKLLINGRAVLVKAEDLSMAGLFVRTELKESVQRITVALPLPGDREVVATCLVRRVDEDGAALEFEQLDWDDMFALARFLHPRLP